MSQGDSFLAKEVPDAGTVFLRGQRVRAKLYENSVAILPLSCVHVWSDQLGQLSSHCQCLSTLLQVGAQHKRHSARPNIYTHSYTPINYSSPCVFTIAPSLGNLRISSHQA